MKARPTAKLIGDDKGFLPPHPSPATRFFGHLALVWVISLTHPDRGMSRLPCASTGRSSSPFRGELVARQGYAWPEGNAYLLHNAHTLNVLHISVSQAFCGAITRERLSILLFFLRESGADAQPSTVALEAASKL
jgi:hypothetical protein